MTPGAEPAGRGASLRAELTRPSARPLGRAAQVSLQVLIVAAALTLLGFVLVQLRLVVLPVLVALITATILVPPTEWLRRRGFPSALAALLVLVVGTALFGGLVALLAPQVADELGDLGESVRAGLNEAVSFLETLGVSSAEIDSSIENGLDELRANAGGIGRSVVTGAIVAAEVVAGLLLVLVLLFFMLKDGEAMWRWFLGLLPAASRSTADEVGRRGWEALGLYVRGVSLVALFDAVLIGIALAILGVPLVLPLAVLVFFSAFVPFVGAITAGLVAALVALVSNGPLTALLVIVVIVVVQQLEGHVVYPLVVGRSLELHPVAVLLPVTGGAVIAGVVGAFLAVPATAVAWAAFSYLRERRASEGGADPPGAEPDAPAEPGSPETGADSSSASAEAPADASAPPAPATRRPASSA